MAVAYENYFIPLPERNCASRDSVCPSQRESTLFYTLLVRFHRLVSRRTSARFRFLLSVALTVHPLASGYSYINEHRWVSLASQLALRASVWSNTLRSYTFSYVARFCYANVRSARCRLAWFIPKNGCTPEYQTYVGGCVFQRAKR